MKSQKNQWIVTDAWIPGLGTAGLLFLCALIAMLISH